MTSTTEEAKEALKRATHAIVRPGFRVELLVEQGTVKEPEWPKMIWCSKDPIVVELMKRFIKKKMDLWVDVGTSRAWFYAHSVSLPDDYYVSTGSVTWSAIWRARMNSDPELFEPGHYRE